MHSGIIQRYAVNAPRYTSYPTAPHFSTAVQEAVQRSWLDQVQAGMSVSIYCHIPFCDTLCWFCGCNTKHTLKYAPVASYLDHLRREIDLVASRLPAGVHVRHISWGGGSPTILSARDILGLASDLRAAFPVAEDAEFSIELDPRDVTPEKIDALVQAGMTRASIGVQDFDTRVQAAINRFQSHDETRDLTAALRAAGIGSINMDVLYGLPHQSEASVEDTIAKVADLRPERIALFGYAHVPWIKKHQGLIDESCLPGPQERYAQAMRAQQRLIDEGYVAIGLDHFALPHDSLALAQADGTLRRNFQGYTVDAYDALIGLGASAISEYPQGYCQNEPSTGLYQARISGRRLAAVKGVAINLDDKVRRRVIERLMCDFRLEKAPLSAEFGALADAVLDEAAGLASSDPDGFFVDAGDAYAITDKGRPFVRAICACFDAYLGRSAARHSMAV